MPFIGFVDLDDLYKKYKPATKNQVFRHRNILSNNNNNNTNADDDVFI